MNFKGGAQCRLDEELQVFAMDRKKRLAVRVTACNPNESGLQSAEIEDHIHSNYHPQWLGHNQAAIAP
jgi:hypothetical protein